MNNKLTEEITYHILSNLGVLPSEFVNQDASRSIIDKQFLLTEKISFQMEGQTINKSIYGCQLNFTNKFFKLILADCSQDSDIPEFAIIIHPPDAPTYGLYLAFTKLVADPPDPEAMIAIKNDQHWIPCTTFLQATFLAGMEQLRDQIVGWKLCVNYQGEYQDLLSFVKFHSNYFGVSHEG